MGKAKRRDFRKRQDGVSALHPERRAKNQRPIMIKGREIHLVTQAKILGVVIDSELRYKPHTAKAATRGVKAALALQRLNGLPPEMARRLFEATVAPIADYASSV